MKIAVLAHLKFPIAPPFMGGLERHTHSLVSGLQARGHAVTLFAAEGSDPDLGFVAVCAPTGPHTGDSDRDAVVDAAEDAAYTRMMDAVATGGFDVVHANCLHGLPLDRAATLPAPTVLVLHVPRFEPFESALAAAAPRIRVIAVSQQLADIWAPVVARIEVVPNGVDLSTFRPRALPRTIAAFWSGRIGPEKGLHLAIDAARRAGLALTVAGARVDEAYWDAEIAPRLGADTHYLGHLGEAPLAEALARAKVAVVSPRWDEPFGLVVPEALASGTPVAAFARGAIPDILDEETGRLATPDDVEDLARAIGEAATLDGEACRRRAEEHFGIAAMIAGYERIYGEAIAARRA